MKLADINAIGGILATMKINRIHDKEAKDALGNTFLAVRKALRPFEKDRDELVEKFRNDWKDEITAILAKQERDFDEYHTAENDLNVAVFKMLDEREADMDFSPIKAELLYAPDLWGEDATLGEIDNAISFLVKHGVAEE